MVPLDMLQKFLIGDLSAAELEEVAAYLESNPAVLRDLQEPHNEPLLQALRAVRTYSPVESTVVERVTGVAEKLRRPGDSSITQGFKSGSKLTTGFQREKPEPTEADTAEASITALLRPSDHLGTLGELGEYRIRRVLGRGGMGVVFEAEDPKLDRKVALKVLAPAIASLPGSKQRFLREAKAMAKVEHDHIIPVYQVGEDRGVPFLAMPLLHGESLDRRLASERALPVEELVLLARQIADGLAAAHAHNLIHRDIKPSNLWLELFPNGDFKRLRILDFGLARHSRSNDGLTHSGTILGTPGYMAPEQARGEPVDARADLFSLGVVLYQMAAGQLPFTGKDVLAVLSSLALDVPKPVHEKNAAVPESLSGLIARLLEKDPNARPASAAEVGQELRGIEQELEALPEALPEIGNWMAAAEVELQPFEEPVRKSRRGLFLVVGLLVLLLGASAAVFAPTLIKIATNTGDLVIETDNPNIEVLVRDGGAQVRDKSTQRTFELTAGDGEVEFYDPETGAKALTKTFRLERAGKVELKANMAEIAAVRKPAPLAPPPVDPRRRSLESVLLNGGLVYLSTANGILEIRDQSKLPPPPWTVNKIAFPNGTALTDAGLEALHEVPAVEHLELKEAAITDEGLIRLLKQPGFRNLRELSLEGCSKITDRVLIELGGLLNLKRVRLNQIALTRSALDTLSQKLPECEITVNGATIGRPRTLVQALDWVFDHGGDVSDTTDPDGVHIRDRKSVPPNFPIRRIRLENNAKGLPEDLSALGLFPELESLSFNQTPVTAKNLEALAKLPKLRCLHLFGTNLRSENLAPLMALTHLQELFVSGNALRNSDLQQLTKLSQLQVLDLGATEITDGAGPFLAQFPQLHTLTLTQTQCTEMVLPSLRKLRHLKTLRLTEANVSAKVLDELKYLDTLELLEYSAGVFSDAARKELIRYLPDCRLVDGAADPKPVRFAPEFTGTIPPLHAFPGKLAAYETYSDDPTAKILHIRDGVVSKIEAGRFSFGDAARTPGSSYSSRFGPALANGTIAVRIQADNASLGLSFQRRDCGFHQSWLQLNITPAGDWKLERRDRFHVLQLEFLNSTEIAMSQQPDPELAAGPWINLAVRFRDSRYQIWRNGTLLTHGVDHSPRTSERPALNAIEITATCREAGPTWVHLQSLAVWDQSTPFDPDRWTAVNILERGGAVRINTPDSPPITKVNDLPEEPFQLSGISLKGESLVADRRMAHLTDCRQLAQVSLDFKKFHEGTLAEFAKIRNLKWLTLSGVTDIGLAHFRKCEKLESLSVNQTKVGNESVKWISGLKELKKLDIRGTSIGPDELKHLKASLPMCQILHD